MNIWGLPVTAKIIVSVTGVCSRAFLRSGSSQSKICVGKESIMFCKSKNVCLEIPELSVSYLNICSGTVVQCRKDRDK